MTTWRALITEALTARGETWRDVVACTLDDAALDAAFEGGFSTDWSAAAFTLWTARHVYLDMTSDGPAWVRCVPREPTP